MLGTHTSPLAVGVLIVANAFRFFLNQYQMKELGVNRRKKQKEMRAYNWKSHSIVCKLSSKTNKDNMKWMRDERKARELVRTRDNETMVKR